MLYLCLSCRIMKPTLLGIEFCVEVYWTRKYNISIFVLKFSRWYWRLCSFILKCTQDNADVYWGHRRSDDSRYFFPFVSFCLFLFRHSYVSDGYLIRFRSCQFRLSSGSIPYRFRIPSIPSSFSVPFRFRSFFDPSRLRFIPPRFRFIPPGLSSVTSRLHSV